MVFNLLFGLFLDFQLSVIRALQSLVISSTNFLDKVTERPKILLRGCATATGWGAVTQTNTTREENLKR